MTEERAERIEIEVSDEMRAVIRETRIKSYCTQNNGDCETCSLVNYGRDCENNPIEKVRESEKEEG